MKNEIEPHFTISVNQKLQTITYNRSYAYHTKGINADKETYYSFASITTMKTQAVFSLDVSSTDPTVEDHITTFKEESKTAQGVLRGHGYASITFACITTAAEEITGKTPRPSLMY